MRCRTQQVAVFTSWSVHRAIVEHSEGALTINTGFMRLRFAERGSPKAERAAVRDADALERSAARRLHHAGSRWIISRDTGPRVLYLGLGETDDWAHDGRYDRVLEALARSDEYLKQLWTWLESQPEYRGRTHMLITTDHGRGRTPK